MFGFSQQASGSSLRDGLPEFPPLASVGRLGVSHWRTHVHLPAWQTQKAIFAVSVCTPPPPFALQD